MKIAFTIDLEPDWGIAGGPCRALTEVLPAFLRWLEGRRIRATFFVLAEMARRWPDGIRRIAEEHEIASHGLSHRRLDSLSRRGASSEMRESKRIIEGVIERRVNGFRAPYLIGRKDLMDHVGEEGYAYDSSGGACAPSLANALLPRGAGPFRRPDGTIWLPISTMRDGLNPFCLTALRVGRPLSFLDLPARPRMFFLHLHELSDLPVPGGAGGTIRRALLRRGQGAAAWRALEKVVEWYRDRGGQWLSCEEYIACSYAACTEGKRTL